MKKIYEIKNMDSCSMSTTYRGVKVNLSFRGGNSASGINGKMITSDPFVQDAIEAMPAFGKKIICTYAYTPARQSVPVVEEKKRPRLVAAKGASDRVSKTKKIAADRVIDTIVVEDVKNLNDAAAYFEEKKGVLVESKEQLAELMEKYNVSFPNLKD